MPFIIRINYRRIFDFRLAFSTSPERLRKTGLADRRRNGRVLCFRTSGVCRRTQAPFTVNRPGRPPGRFGSVHKIGRCPETSPQRAYFYSGIECRGIKKYLHILRKINRKPTCISGQAMLRNKSSVFLQKRICITGNPMLAIISRYYFRNQLAFRINDAASRPRRQKREEPGYPAPRSFSVTVR